MDANASVVVTHFGSTLLVVSSIQWLKKIKSLKFVQAGTKFVSRAISLIAAFCVQAGIHYTWATNPDGTHNLGIQGISLAVLAIGAFHVASQFIYQETGYQALQGIQAVQGILNFLQSAGPAIPVSPTPEPVTASSGPAPQNAPLKP